MIALQFFAAVLSLSASTMAAALPRGIEISSPADAIVARALGNNDDSWIKDFPIHESCNASQKLQLQRGFDDLNRLARSAADHILAHGNSSELFVTYFGAAADPATPLGIFERMISGDKTGTLFRCDDPDRNCATQDGWNGHWRGSNATDETVICDLSFVTRRSLDAACGLGFKLATDNVNLYWGTDLLHRSMHLPKLTNEHITHVADEYPALLELAKTNASFSTRNQHTIQDFAFEVWTRENIDPQGCVGEINYEAANATSTTTAMAAPTGTSTDSASAVPAQSTPAAAAKDCHTHADGTVHCA
ncbi:hypothetical protein CF327_g5610 [Tilletia walkeri]|uniref:Putative peptidase domain-containing protein n=1 Tax=Tilletia walkeri TaxID=117179 RepID=A0A8X7T2Z6_9BASI|nr:hypothetical protein CF327_g5610 [Tilletia walkeri]KAE8265636.1 hypothetical protein A4X09_0g6576 [Tilletia walkeri]